MASTSAQLPAHALHVPGGTRKVWWIDSTVDVKLTAAETDGQLGMWLWVAERGAASPLHVHHQEDEQFLMIDGTARFRIGEQWLDAASGDSIWLPRDVPHAFVVEDDAPARILSICSPGGLEGYFVAAGRPAERPELPPREPVDVGMLARVGEAFGVEVLGPPMAPRRGRAA